MSRLLFGDRLPHLLPLRDKGDAEPLYVVHPVGGGLAECRQLAQSLQHGLPVYGLLARGLDGVDDPLDRVEDMAEAYLRDIRAYQPRSPYFLVGYCYGGYVAFEMARRLVAERRRVALLALIDTHAVNVPGLEFRWDVDHVRNLVRGLPGWWAEARRQGLARLSARLRDRLALELHPLVARYRHRRSGGGSSESPLPRRLNEWNMPEQLRQRLAADTTRLPGELRVREAHYRALGAYRPRPFPGRITLLRCRTQGLFVSHDSQLGWGSLAQDGVEVVDLPGTNRDNVVNPSLALAEALDRAIGRARENLAVTPLGET